MFVLAEFACRHHFDVRFSLKADLTDNCTDRFVPEADCSNTLRI